MLTHLVASPNVKPSLAEVGHVESRAELSLHQAPDSSATATAAAGVTSSDVNLSGYTSTAGNVALDLLGVTRPLELARQIRSFEKTASLFTKPSEDELEGWRLFLVELQGAIELKDSVQSAQAMREVFADHPQIFAWFAANRNLADLVEYYPSLTVDSKFSAESWRQFDEVGSQLWDGCRALVLGKRLWNEVLRARELLSGINEHGVRAHLEPSAVAAKAGRALWDFGQARAISMACDQVASQVRQRVHSLNRDERLEVLNYVPDSAFLIIRSHIA